MTDERLAELNRIVFPTGGNIRYDLVSELLQALKAEREEVEAWKNIYETMYNKSCEAGLADVKRIAELEAQSERQVREIRNLDESHRKRIKELEAQLDAVKEMVGIDARCNCLSDDDTLTEPCGKCLACAIRKALEQKDDE